MDGLKCALGKYQFAANHVYVWPEKGCVVVSKGQGDHQNDFEE
jgi:hypothetical protein